MTKAESAERSWMWEVAIGALMAVFFALILAIGVAFTMSGGWGSDGDSGGGMSGGGQFVCQQADGCPLDTQNVSAR